MKCARPRGGFTIIETILYIAIVSMMLVSITSLIIDVMGGQMKTSTYQDVTYYERFIVNQLMKDIRNASNVSTLTSSTLVLTQPGGTITYNFNSLNNQLTRQVGSGTPVELHQSTLAVAGSFIDQSYAGRTKTVGVNLQLVFYNAGGREEFTANSTVQFAVELRGRR